MRFLVTAGPTREPIDDVRFISNPSTGRMGYAIAEAAARAGHAVTLISGPAALPDPHGVQVVRVTTTQQMYDAVMERLDAADVLIAAAAPCDYRPDAPRTGKMKKTAPEISLRLVPTPDALLDAGRSKGRRVHIGFALEVQDARPNALDKLRRKRLDAVVLNAPSAFGADQTSVTLIRSDGAEEDLSAIGKDKLGLRLVALAEEIWKSRNP